MTENQLEQETLGWLAELGYAVHTGAELAHDGPNPQRVNHRQVVLPGRLRAAMERLNPGIPAAAREDAWQRVKDLGLPSLLSANRALHKLLVGGVPVQYMRDGETVGDWVRLVDWLLAPPVLLDYLRHFVLFEDDGALVKKIAGYHQFHAVRAAVAQVVAASRPDSAAGVRGKGGVVWHTQGSGSCVTMTCFAARVMQEPAIQRTR